MALQFGHQEAVSAFLEGTDQFRDKIEPRDVIELLALCVRTIESGVRSGNK